MKKYRYLALSIALILLVGISTGCDSIALHASQPDHKTRDLFQVLYWVQNKCFYD